jgi:hypothetical protein
VVKAMVNRGKSSQHVLIRTKRWFADGIRVHGVFTRCALRLTRRGRRLFGRPVEVVGRAGGAGG